MSDVDKIALWIGLISGIVSIVLSIVAMVFAVQVNNRSSKVSDQTIQSLQKIESTVERLSGDSRELIKAGWDKMLGSVAREPDHIANDLAAKQIASGILAEMNAELVSKGESKDNAPIPTREETERMNELLNKMETLLTSQLQNLSRPERPSEAIDITLDKLKDLSPVALALAHAILPWHLSFQQYDSLRKASPLSEAVSELRENGFLVPLEGRSKDGEKIPVYWFPPPSRIIKAALSLGPDPSRDVLESVKAQLNKIGYTYGTH